MIPVTKPFLPSIEEYEEILRSIWQRNWLTNNGPIVQELEIRLKKYLNVENLLFLGNGTIALQIAIKALELTGEIITTPFSYVATTSSIVWENCIPIFVDIDAETLNIDTDQIENAITDRTSGILATHVFGNPCNIEAIQSIADKFKLKVIYDAAHAFGVSYKGKSIFDYGDVSTVSFHATKVFHTIEGGAVMTKSSELLRTMEYMRNFGHDGPDKINGVGINGKNSEFHAAMGIVNLRHIGPIFKKRKKIYDRYIKKLSILNIRTQKLSNYDNHNYSYVPIIFENEFLLLTAISVLNKEKIYPRRYFYPILSQLGYVRNFEMLVAEKVSKCILCLPIYHEMEIDLVDKICDIAKSCIIGSNF